jgi:hypothetical protein
MLQQQGGLVKSGAGDEEFHAETMVFAGIALF